MERDAYHQTSPHFWRQRLWSWRGRRSAAVILKQKGTTHPTQSSKRKKSESDSSIRNTSTFNYKTASSYVLNTKGSKAKTQIINSQTKITAYRHVLVLYLQWSKLPKCMPSASPEQFPIAQKIFLSQAFFQCIPFLNFTQYFLFCLLLFIVMTVFRDLERFSHIVPGTERVQKSPKSLRCQCSHLQSLSLAVFKKKIENIGQNIFVRTGKGHGIHNPQYPLQPHFPLFQCTPHE